MKLSSHFTFPFTIFKKIFHLHLDFSSSFVYFFLLIPLSITSIHSTSSFFFFHQFQFPIAAGLVKIKIIDQFFNMNTLTSMKWKRCLSHGGIFPFPIENSIQLCVAVTNWIIIAEIELIVWCGLCSLFGNWMD